MTDFYKNKRMFADWLENKIIQARETPIPMASLRIKATRVYGIGGRSLENALKDYIDLKQAKIEDDLLIGLK